MNSRQRVLAALAHAPFDRLPVKHLADPEIDRRLARHFGACRYEDLLDRLGHDFREIRPAYTGPDFGLLESEHGIISGTVMARAAQAQRPEQSDAPLPLANLSSPAEAKAFATPLSQWYNYRAVADQCADYGGYATILGYCEGDFINGLSGLRGQEQVLVDIALGEPVFLELVEQRFQAVYEHLERGLAAGGGQVDFVHYGEDLGSQTGPLISVRAYRALLGRSYRALFALAHRYAARAMLHACGSVAAFLPALIDDGLDVLDVVQTNAAGMDLARLKQDFGWDLAFAGTMCVQKVLPFATPAQVRQEVRRRTELFSDGGLILGPSHQIQPDTPLENILAMYEEMTQKTA